MKNHLTMQVKEISTKSFEYIWLFLTGIVSILLFRILNRTVVIGKENVPKGPGVLYLSNHRTMIDSFLIATTVAFPACVYDFKAVPYSPAATENFFKNKLLAFMSATWRCIPVDRSRSDLAAMRNIMKLLKDSNVLLFPEGTRSRNGEVGEAKNGVGMIIRETTPLVVPVFVDGIEEVLPIGCRNPRVGKRITLSIGKPIDFTDVLQQNDRRRAITIITHQVMDEIRALQRGCRSSAQAA